MHDRLTTPEGMDEINDARLRNRRRVWKVKKDKEVVQRRPGHAAGPEPFTHPNRRLSPPPLPLYNPFEQKVSGIKDTRRFKTEPDESAYHAPVNTSDLDTIVQEAREKLAELAGIITTATGSSDNLVTTVSIDTTSLASADDIAGGDKKRG